MGGVGVSECVGELEFSGWLACRLRCATVRPYRWVAVSPVLASTFYSRARTHGLFRSLICLPSLRDMALRAFPAGYGFTSMTRS